MESLYSKALYLSGFIDGLEFDQNSKEGRAFEQIIKFLEELAGEIDELKENQTDIEEYLDEIDEDLAYIEDDLYETDEEINEDDIDDFIELKCGNCGEVIYIDAGIADEKEEMYCPSCHQLLKFEEIETEE